MHRDIKPSNVLITWGVDNQLVVKLADFGTAKPLPDNTSEPQTFTGTLGFQPREMKTGAVYDKSCDIWSAGVTVAVCGAGRGYIGGANSSTEAGASGNPVVSEFLKKHKDATIVQRMALAERGLRPTAEDILKDDWVKDRGGPNEDAVSVTEIQEAQDRATKLAKDLASVQAEKEEALQQKKEADTEINRLRSELRALQAKAGSMEKQNAHIVEGPENNEERAAARKVSKECRSLFRNAVHIWY